MKSTETAKTQEKTLLRKDETFVLVNFKLDPEMREAFKVSCQLLEKKQTDIFHSAVRRTIAEAKQKAAEIEATRIPEFATLTLDEAQAFLSPYYSGRPPSIATILRRVKDRTIIAVQDYPSRTGPTRIVKASLVQWMARLGKQIESETW